MDSELDAFEQALHNPKASTSLNEWLDKRLDEKLGALDAKWEDRFQKLDNKWEQRFQTLEAKLDAKFELVEFLKEQNKSQDERLTKLQAQLDAKNEEIIALLRGIGASKPL